MGFSAFQTGYQAGFQVIYSHKRPDPNGNKLRSYTPYGYELEKYRRAERLEQLRKQEELARQDLYAQELKIDRLEIKRLKRGLADKTLQAELLQLLNQQYIINLALAQYQSEIQELLLDQEALMVIMLTMEF